MKHTGVVLGASVALFFACTSGTGGLWGPIGSGSSGGARSLCPTYDGDKPCPNDAPANQAAVDACARCLSVAQSLYDCIGSRPTCGGDGKTSFPTVTSQCFPENTTYLACLAQSGDAGTSTLFSSAPTLTVGRTPVAIVLVDLNGDKKLDIVTGNSGDGTLSVLLGNGDGTFGKASIVVVGARPFALVALDLDVDGKMDLVTANGDGNGTVSVFLGKGDGTFGAPAAIAAPSSTGLAGGDVNGDKKPDLVVDGLAGRLVLLGNGDGTFVAVNGADAGSGGVDAGGGADGGVPVRAYTLLADLNGDSKLDVVNAPANSVTVALGNGDGTFGNPTSYKADYGLVGTAAADFNGDGKPDLATASSYPAAAYVFLANGDGTFATGARFGLEQGSFTDTLCLAVGDVNLDGKQDVLGGSVTGEGVDLLFGKGDGSFAPAVPDVFHRAPVAMALGDVNGDGKPDLVSADVDSVAGAVSVLLNTSR